MTAASLGDLLPKRTAEATTKKIKEIQMDSAPSEIVPGMVIRIYDEFAEKPKWHVVLGVDNEDIMIGVVRINSELNENVHRTPDLVALQYELKKKDNTFLDWDSFVDCSQIIPRKKKDYQNHINENPSEHLGNVTREDFDLLTSIVATADTISPKQLKKYNIS